MPAENTAHQRIGAQMDGLPQDSGRDPGVKAEQLYSDVYLTYSNYVHAKYPGTMDLYAESRHIFISVG
jgi:hypothetical protein